MVGGDISIHRYGGGGGGEREIERERRHLDFRKIFIKGRRRLCVSRNMSFRLQKDTVCVTEYVIPNLKGIPYICNAQRKKI
jgi:hypothetical protein